MIPESAKSALLVAHIYIEMQPLCEKETAATAKRPEIWWTQVSFSTCLARDLWGMG